jgi:UDP-N-acetylmuramoyl-L-alanyl-D-glutamate--2,6-diaminopimelate ligase
MINGQSKIGFEFPNTGIEALGIKVERLTTNSRKIKRGDTFVAYAGKHADGRSYIEQAINAGAASVLWEKNGFKWNPDWKVPNLGIANLQDKLGEIAHEVYGRPSNRLWMIGVTGTNGKTSCTHWLAQCFNALGKKTAVIGTLGNGFLGELQETSNTTPDAAEIHSKLAEYLAAGAQCVAMEVSSHGLDQGRVNGIAFDLAMFTNLSRDHLDYHKDMQDYAQAKAKLFDWPNLSNAIINLDDSFGAQLTDKLKKRNSKTLTYGLTKADICTSNLKLSPLGMEMEIKALHGSAKLSSGLLGEFNASNLLGSLGILLASGVSLENAAQVLGKVKSVAGRMERVGDINTPAIVIDYAHSPDALEKVLQTLRRILNPNARLICVFGCGGERDKGKRPVMGRIATSLADKVFITSDNPRSEDPRQIIKEITEGASGDYRVIEDRQEAIQQSVEGANAADILLIAGKGHEQYQEIAGKKYPFSDVAVAQSALRSWKKNREANA